jgi:hypothetical protein
MQSFLKRPGSWQKYAGVVTTLSLLMSACSLFLEQAPCKKDENCLTGQRCDLQSERCVDNKDDAATADAGHDDVQAVDTRLVDSLFADVQHDDRVSADRSGVDHVAVDNTGNDQTAVDIGMDDAGSVDSFRDDRSGQDLWSPCIDNDSDLHGVDCVAGLDCDDDDNQVYEGTACDDSNPLTIADVCQGGICRGHPIAPTGCSNGCATCSATTCCAETCDSPSCTDCGSDCSCYQRFNTSNRNITAHCLPNSTCTLNVVCGRNAATECDAASCYLYCDGNNGDCDMQCSNNAACLVYCGSNVRLCTISGCTESPTSCSDGHLACGRPCP